MDTVEGWEGCVAMNFIDRGVFPVDVFFNLIFRMVKLGYTFYWGIFGVSRRSAIRSEWIMAGIGSLVESFN